MPVPRGKKDNPTNDSMVELLPADWLPSTTIWGRESRASVAPSVAASCWSRASVSTTAPSTTRVGCWGVAMIVTAVVDCCGFLCRGYGPAVGVGRGFGSNDWISRAQEFRLALAFVDRVRRLAAVAKNRCVVLAASNARGSATRCERRANARPSGKNSSSSFLTRGNARTTDRRRPRVIYLLLPALRKTGF
jgi:hypothetical protein